MRAAVLALLLGGAGTTAAAPYPVYFHEPHSGQKVTEYRVELPITREKRRPFTLPAECDEALEALAAGAGQWGGRVERSLWWKVEGDCRYHAFLNRYTRLAPNDYVGGYDFRNGDLSALPLRTECVRLGEECREVRRVEPELGRILPLVERLEGGSAEACRLEAGSFRGYIALEGGEVRCRRDPHGPGLRVVSVDYGDVNGDGYQDAILRLVPLGPRLGRTPLVLPITRTAPGARFTLPEGAQPPERR